MKLRKTFAVLALVWLGLPLVAPTDAVAQEIGFFVGFVAPTGDLTESAPGFGSITLEADSTVGFGATYRYRFSETASFGASILNANHDVDISVDVLGVLPLHATVGEITNLPILFDLNYHFAAGDWEPYIGLTLGYSMWGDFEVSVDFDLNGDNVIDPDDDLVAGADIGIDASLAYGVNFGLDYAYSDSWKVSFAGRYLVQDAEESETGESFDVNPFIATIGVFYSF